MPAKGWAKLTPEQIAQGTEEYFIQCDNATREVIVGKRVATVSRPYTIIGLCNHLGITKECFYHWLDGNHPRDKERADTSRDCNKGRSKGGRTAASRPVDEQKGEQAYISVSDLLARARGRVEASTLERSLTGELDGKVAGMVLGNMGYSTKQEVAHTGGIEVKLTGATDAQAKAWSK